MIPCIVATYDQPSTVIESIDGEVVARTIGVQITVECPVENIAAGHAALNHAVAQIRIHRWGGNRSSRRVPGVPLTHQLLTNTPPGMRWPWRGPCGEGLT